MHDRTALLRERALAISGNTDYVGDLEARGLLWWYVAVNEPDPHKRPPILADVVEAGYFKTSSGAHGPLVPTAIWRAIDDAGNWSGDLQASRGFRPVEAIDDATLRKSWVWIAKRPISYEEYVRALEAGMFATPASEGGNSPPPDGIEALQIAIAEQAGAAESWLEKYEKPGGQFALDQAAAEAAAKKREDLNALHRKADEQRKQEADPHYKAWEETNARWAFAKRAKTIADRLYTAIKAFAEQERRRREEAARAAVLANKPLEEIKPAEPVRIKGAARAVSLPKPTPKCIVTDHAKALEFVKDRQEIKDAVAALVQRLHEAGVEDIPGTKVERVAA